LRDCCFKKLYPFNFKKSELYNKEFLAKIATKSTSGSSAATKFFKANFYQKIEVRNRYLEVEWIYQSSLKLEQNPALVYQETQQRGDADISARKKLYWNPKDFRYIPKLLETRTNFKNFWQGLLFKNLAKDRARNSSPEILAQKF
jgi:hypothetical protein